MFLFGGSRLVEFGNALADGAFFQDLLAVRYAGQDGGGTQAIDLLSRTK
jgi:hypothetical protein